MSASATSPDFEPSSLNAKSRRWRWSLVGLVWFIFLAPALSNTLHPRTPEMITVP